MAEVTAADLRSTGLRGKELTTLNIANLIFMFGRDYFSKYRRRATGAGPMINDKWGFRERSYRISNGSAKRILATKPIKLQKIKYGGIGLGSDITLSDIGFSQRTIIAELLATGFTWDDGDLLDTNGRVIPALKEAVTMQAVGASIDDVIMGAFTRKLSLVQYDNTSSNSWYNSDTRKYNTKLATTTVKTNYTYRDEGWTTSDGDHFNHETIHKIRGFFDDKKVLGPIYIQITPKARQLLGKTEEGDRMLQDGGTIGVSFIGAATDEAAGHFIEDNSNIASAYASGKITLASRELQEKNVDDRLVYFGNTQTMTAVELNKAAVGAESRTAFTDIEIDRDHLIAAWDSDSLCYGEFDELNQSAERRDIRLLDATEAVTRIGIGSVISNENKVMLIPLSGKTK